MEAQIRWAYQNCKELSATPCRDEATAVLIRHLKASHHVQVCTGWEPTDARSQARPWRHRQDYSISWRAMDALSLSNLSAGDFAMDAGHEEAYEIPLNTGIQAELVLERLRGKRNKNRNWIVKMQESPTISM
ncbi:uncharacterized protein LOC109949712 [Prunus persica]|uniref:uncharacterized protein LOC109949712 n=1 Tax=Prunus persica TaxID=3760 RepID=UPI0009AB4327|nr:uncharacterized protein LOC109949712 [Prunus persica]